MAVAALKLVATVGFVIWLAAVMSHGRDDWPDDNDWPAGGAPA